MADDPFSGFARGWAAMSGIKERKAAREAAAARASLAEKLGIQRMEMETERIGIAREDLGLRKSAAETLKEHQKVMEGIEKDKLDLQKRAGDLDIAKALIGSDGILDTSVSAPMRKFKLKVMARTLGIDPKSEQYKDMESLLTSEAPELSGFKSYVTKVIKDPNVDPGTVTAIATLMFQGKVTEAQKMIESYNSGGKTPSDKAPIQVIKDGKRVWVDPADAVGLEAPGAMTKTTEEEAATAEATALAASGVKTYDADKVATQAVVDLKPAVDLMTTAIESKKFPTGVASGPRLFFGRIARLTGLDKDPDVQKFLETIGSANPMTAEIIEAAGAKMQLAIADQASRVTNLSLSIVLDAVPNLMKTVEGNTALAHFYQRLVQRAQKQQDLQIEYQGDLTPEGKDSYMKAKAKLDEVDPVVNDALRKEIEKADKIGSGMDLPAIINGAKAETEGALKPGAKITMGNGDSFTFVEFKNGHNIVDAGKYGKIPVIWDQEDLPEMAGKGKFIAGWLPAGNNVKEYNPTKEDAAPSGPPVSKASSPILDRLTDIYKQTLIDKGRSLAEAEKMAKEYRKRLAK